MSSLLSSSTTYGPIYRILNTDDEKEQDRLTERWKDNKLQELNFVGIVVRPSILSVTILVSQSPFPPNPSHGLQMLKRY